MVHSLENSITAGQATFVIEDGGNSKYFHNCSNIYLEILISSPEVCDCFSDIPGLCELSSDLSSVKCRSLTVPGYGDDYGSCGHSVIWQCLVRGFYCQL